MELPNLTTELEVDNISCECHTNNEHRPGESSLGDSICRQSISSVRETIKKYEPIENINCGQEIKRGSYGSLRSLKSARSLSNGTQQIQIQNCAAPRSSREVINQHIVYDDHNNNNSNNHLNGNHNSYLDKQENISRKSINYSNNKLHNDDLTSGQGYQSNGNLLKKNDLEYIRGKDVDDNNNNNNNKLNISGNTFNSTNGINNSEYNKCNANNSDISYQSKTTIAKTSNGVRIITDIFFDSNTEYNWQGSRIETDIPPSKILKDFQEKNHLK